MYFVYTLCYYKHAKKGDFMETITIKAMAKINLGLDVLRRREDGYHEVKMVMQTVAIHDTLRFTKRADKRIILRVDGADLPVDQDNLIYKAAQLLYEKASMEEGVEIVLTKRIPIAAGMAGGSTDAAATLVGMNCLFGLGYSEDELMTMGVALGADIPYCIRGGTALSEGIGEQLTPLPAVPEAWLVVAKPPIDVSTAYVYKNLNLEGLTGHPDIDGMVEAIRRQDLTGITDRMENVMETVTERDYPVIGRLKAILKENGAYNALMSGSGPTVFGIFGQEEQARRALKAVKDSGLALQSYQTVFCDKAQVAEEEQEAS